MKRLLLACLVLVWALPAWAQGPEVGVKATNEFSRAFTSSTSSTCFPTTLGISSWMLGWQTTGTVSAGTIKLVGSATSSCASTTDIIAAQTATSSGAVGPVASVWPYVQLVAESYTGTGTINAFARGDKSGGITDPCNGLAKTVTPFSFATATTTQLLAASVGNAWYICSFNLVTLAANNVALIEDDTSACATPTAGMAGGTTAATGWNFAANGGIALGNGSGTVAKTAAANRYVCLISSAATQTSGTITAVAAP